MVSVGCESKVKSTVTRRQVSYIRSAQLLDDLGPIVCNSIVLRNRAMCFVSREIFDIQ